MNITWHLVKRKTSQGGLGLIAAALLWCFGLLDNEAAVALGGMALGWGGVGLSHRLLNLLHLLSEILDSQEATEERYWLMFRDSQRQDREE